MRARLAALLLLASAAVAPSAHGSTTDTLSLALPGTTWSLEIAAPGFEVLHDALSPDGAGRRISAAHREKRLAMSAFLGRAVDPEGTARDARTYYWSLMQQEGLAREKVRMADFGAIALVEYVVPVLDGRTVNQRNMNAYLAKDGHWADVNLKLEDADEDAESLFRDLLRGIRFNEAYAATPYDRMRFGSVLLGRGDTGGAIAELQGALDQLEKGAAADEETSALVHERLGMALLNAGRADDAVAVLRRGMAVVPGHAMFSYLLARVDVLAGRLDDAIGNLRAAYAKQREADQGVTLPDPRQDGAFRRLADDPAFRELMEKNPPAR